MFDNIKLTILIPIKERNRRFYVIRHTYFLKVQYFTKLHTKMPTLSMVMATASVNK